MKYNELSDTAKRKALNAQCEHAMSYEWWDFTFMDFASVAKCLGLDLGRVLSGGHWVPNIHFDIYRNECTFIAEFHPEYDGKCVERIKEYAPQDEELLRIAQALQDASTPVIGIEQHYGAAGLRVRISMSSHKNMMYIGSACADYLYLEEGKDEGARLEIEKMCDDFDQAVLNCCLDLASWLLKNLKAEEEYLCSEARLIEDDFDFDEDGNVV